MRHVKLRPDRDVDAKALRELIETAYTDMKGRLRVRDNACDPFERDARADDGGGIFHFDLMILAVLLMSSSAASRISPGGSRRASRVRFVAASRAAASRRASVCAAVLAPCRRSAVHTFWVVVLSVTTPPASRLDLRSNRSHRHPGGVEGLVSRRGHRGVSSANRCAQSK